jgi:hypothetical protein
VRGDNGSAKGVHAGGTIGHPISVDTGFDQDTTVGIEHTDPRIGRDCFLVNDLRSNRLADVCCNTEIDGAE